MTYYYKYKRKQEARREEFINTQFSGYTDEDFTEEDLLYIKQTTLGFTFVSLS